MAQKVSEIMTPAAVAVRSSQPVTEAAKIMCRRAAAGHLTWARR